MRTGHHQSQKISPPLHSLSASTTFNMFRTALLRSVKSASSHAARRASAIARPTVPSLVFTKSQVTPSVFHAARCYSAASGLQKPEVEGRIVDLLKNFDRVRLFDNLGVLLLIDIYRSPIQRRYIEFWLHTRLGSDIDSAQLTPTSHFANDLGLDSLDTVEVVMAIEEVSVQRFCVSCPGY